MAGKILVVELEIKDDRTKRDAMKIVAGIIGIHSMDIGDGTDKKLTVKCGKADPFEVVKKLRKLVRTNIISIGSPKIEQPKKEEPKKEEPKKAEVKKTVYTEAEVDKLIHETRVQEMVKSMHGLGVPSVFPHTQFSYSVDEDPTACAIL